VLTKGVTIRYPPTNRRYYKSLTNIETRFPISGEKGHVKLSFPWADAFRSSKKTTQSNIHFEKAAVLFNLAAVMRSARALWGGGLLVQRLAATAGGGGGGGGAGAGGGVLPLLLCAPAST